MKLVSSYNELILKALGLQEYKKNFKYRLAGHTYKAEQGDKIFLYNNIVKRLYCFDKKEIEEIEKFNSIDFNKYKSLYEDWTIVPENFNDILFADQARWFYKSLRQNCEKPTFTILVTTKCNARCYYCFENGQRRIHMTEEIASDVADYIIKKSQNKEIFVKWFGGEPLYNPKAIDIICDRLLEAGINYKSSITTNGYLFDDESVIKAKTKWNLKSAVITLDGTEEVYNKTKNYIYKDGNPFRIVIDNIDRLLMKDIRVSIRLNIGFENFENIKELVIYLKKRFGENEKISFLPIALYDLDGTRSDQEHLLLESMVKEIDQMTSKGKYRKITLKSLSTIGSNCMAESDNAYLISPIGELGTCEHYTEGEMMYGSIYSDVENLTIKNCFKSKQVLDKCAHCVFYSSCGGIGKCPTQTKNCNDSDRETRIRNLNKFIINTYEEYLANGEISLL